MFNYGTLNYFRYFKFIFGGKCEANSSHRLYSTNIAKHNNNDSTEQEREQNENVTFRTPTTEEPLFVDTVLLKHYN